MGLSILEFVALEVAENLQATLEAKWAIRSEQRCGKEKSRGYNSDEPG